MRVRFPSSPSSSSARVCARSHPQANPRFRGFPLGSRTGAGTNTASATSPRTGCSSTASRATTASSPRRHSPPPRRRGEDTEPIIDLRAADFADYADFRQCPSKKYRTALIPPFDGPPPRRGPARCYRPPVLRLAAATPNKVIDHRQYCNSGAALQLRAALCFWPIYQSARLRHPHFSHLHPPIGRR